MIQEYAKKVKDWFETNKLDIYLAIFIFLVGLIGFGLGRISILWIPKKAITITSESTQPDQKNPNSSEKSSSTAINKTASILGKFVASKSGTAYHFPWCPGALKIKEGNKVWFQTKEEAETQGYKPAGNCPGL